VTRDTLLPRRFKDTSCLLIDSEVIGGQLAQVVAAFDIDVARRGLSPVVPAATRRSWGSPAYESPAGALCDG